MQQEKIKEIVKKFEDFEKPNLLEECSVFFITLNLYSS